MANFLGKRMSIKGSPVTSISIPKVIFFSTYSSCKMQWWCKFSTVSSGALKKGDSGGLGAKCFWSQHMYIHRRRQSIVSSSFMCDFVNHKKHLQKYYIVWHFFLLVRRVLISSSRWANHQIRPWVKSNLSATRFLSLFVKKENCTLGQCVYKNNELPCPQINRLLMKYSKRTI